jgi:POT family proton-dependent oligopeptide transporter
LIGLKNDFMKKGFFGHPAGLSTLFFTEMWERFSYYGMRALLILFMTATAAEGGLGFNEEKSAAIYGLYTAGVYLLTLPGGWLADRVFGTRKTIWYGGIMIMLGHFTLAIPSTSTFFLGLIFIVLGTGMLKPNISTIVGDLYPDKGARRDAGFSIFYMGINLGAFAGPMICGYLGENVNWHLGFVMAGVGMFFGLLQYRLTANRNLGELGLKPNISDDTSEYSSTGNKNLGYIFVALVVVLLAVLQLTGTIDMFTARGFAEAVFVIIAVVVLLYFGYVIFAVGLSIPEKKKVFVIFLLVLGAAMFWSGFEQAGSSLNLFAETYTNRIIGGWEVPASWLQAVNPIFIIIFAPLFGALWVRLARANMNPRTPIKFAIGLVLLGVGFLVMVKAAKIAANGLQAAPFYLILTYFLHTTGELCLSPIGLSNTTKLAPKRYVGQMMGMWFVGAALGNLVAGLVAGDFNSEVATQLPDMFMSIVFTSVGAGIVFLALSPLMSKWMDDIH